MFSIRLGHFTAIGHLVRKPYLSGKKTMPATTPKVLTLLQTFSPEEMQQFNDFVQSPFFNKKAALVALFQEIYRLYPNLNNWNAQAAFTAMFNSQKAYNEKYMNNLLSDLWALAKQFLVQTDLALRPIEQQYFITEELTMRNLLPQAERELKTLDNLLNQQKHAHTDYYELRVSYNRIADYLLYKQQNTHRRNLALQEKLEGLLHYYWYYTFKLCAVMSGLQTTSTSFQFDLSKVKPLFKHFNPDDYPNQPHLQAAYYMMRLNEPDAEWFEFEHLFLLVEQKPDAFSPDLRKMLSVFLANYLSRQNLLQPLLPEQMQTWFTLYHNLVQLHQKETMPPWLFDATVRTGCIVMGAEWALQFVQDYRRRLLPDFEERYVPFAMACIYFTQANYADAILNLSAIAPNNASFYFKIKVLLLLAYYHTQNYDAYLLTADTVKHTLRSRTEIAAPEQEYLKNTLAALDKLYKLRLGFSQKLYEQLAGFVFDPHKPIAHKQWLQNQLTTLNLSAPKRVKSKFG